MSLARPIYPGSFYLLSRRCTQRLFLLRPDAVTSNHFAYCLFEAALRFGIVVLLPLAMSNHHHTILYDPHGNVVAFMEHFHKMFAKVQNARLGRWENLWASEQPSLVRLEGPEDVLDKMVYVATNPVAAGLVERSHQWPGVNGLPALLAGRSMVARRPTHFFAADSQMPEVVSLEPTIPPELGDAAAIKRALRERVRAAEDRLAREREAAGLPVLGVRAVLAQAFTDSPSTVDPRRTLSPRVAARNLWRRIEALRRNRDFLDAYRAARLRWRAGLAAVFPAGTYWLHRFAGVPVVPLAQP